MKLATGRWVTGDDFFGREADLRQLESQVRNRNPVLSRDNAESARSKSNE